MSIFRARHVVHLRGLLSHARQFPKQDAYALKQRLNGMSMQRSQGHRDLRVHRQSDRAWRPPPATNERLNGMQVMKESAGRAEYGSSRMAAQAHARVKTGPKRKVRVTAPEEAGASASGNPLGGGMFLSYHDLELALERRGLNAVRVLLTAAGALVVGIGLMWPRIKRWGAAEGAEVAAASLQQEELKMHATALVNALIAEPKTTRQVESMLKTALLALLEDEEIKREATKWTSDVFAEAMMWPGVLAKGTEYVESVLKDPKSIDYAYDYFSTAAQLTANDEKVQDAVSQVSCHGCCLPS